MASFALIAVFNIFSFVFIIAALLKIYAPVPTWFTETFLYGKVKSSQHSKWRIISVIEVPKSAFLYFYIWGSFWCTAMFAFALRSYLHAVPPPAFIQNLFSRLFEQNAVTTSATSALLGCAMLVFQLYRRTMECLVVSVYSKGTMNVLHFLLGVMFYTSVSLAILSESPTLDGKVYNVMSDFFKARHIVGINLFFIAAYFHNQTNRIFASLRKNKDGKVCSYQHRIPRGGLFYYVSCPHYFMEIVTYLAVWMTVGFTNLTMATMFVFVLVNQSILGYFSHQWYRQTFKTYPEERKAVLPYLF